MQLSVKTPALIFIFVFFERGWGFQTANSNITCTTGISVIRIPPLISIISQLLHDFTASIATEHNEKSDSHLYFSHLHLHKLDHMGTDMKVF